MIFVLFLLFLQTPAEASIPPLNMAKPDLLQKSNHQKESIQKFKTSLTFDIPITYNKRVKKWIQYFQTNGRKSYKRWLERSNRYIPYIQETFKEHGLPSDLAYLAMIESGFSPFAKSPASAVGYWQFIKPTGKRFGLKINWWLDERRDFIKSTEAAATYLKKLYNMFGSWYLAAAAYNTGENRVRRLLKKHKTTSYWELVEKKALHPETRDYVPKLLAAVLMAKTPALYGFRKLNYKTPPSYEYFWAAGGTNLKHMAKYAGIPLRDLKYLNPALIRNYIPKHVNGYQIRIPQGTLKKCSKFFLVSKAR